MLPSGCRSTMAGKAAVLMVLLYMQTRAVMSRAYSDRALNKD